MHKFFILLSLHFLCISQLFGITQEIDHLYAFMLGNEDARSEYKSLAHEALTIMGVKNSEKVLVKKMNDVGPAFARVNISSFTAFGIWIDETYLDTCSKSEKIFHLYHEAAHYAQQHHQKTLIVSALSLAGVFFALKILYTLNKNKSLAHFTLVVSSAVLAGSGMYTYLLPMAVKMQEKQADLLAAKMLILTGQQNVLENYIANLRKIKKSEEAILWWDSIAEQITYLEECQKQISATTSI